MFAEHVDGSDVLVSAPPDWISSAATMIWDVLYFHLTALFFHHQMELSILPPDRVHYTSIIRQSFLCYQIIECLSLSPSDGAFYSFTNSWSFYPSTIRRSLLSFHHQVELSTLIPYWVSSGSTNKLWIQILYVAETTESPRIRFRLLSPTLKVM